MTVRVRVLELYGAGLALPLGEPGGADSGPKPQPPVDWPGFDRIYFDVRRGLELWRSGASPAAAAWEWRFHFDAHWRNHAVGALRRFTTRVARSDWFHVKHRRVRFAFS